MSNSRALEGAEWTNVGIISSAAVLFPGGEGGGWGVGEGWTTPKPPGLSSLLHSINKDQLEPERFFAAESCSLIQYGPVLCD